MKTQPINKTRILARSVAIAGIIAMATAIFAADTNTNTVPQKVNATPKKAPAIKKKLTGADLYAINCNRCHPDRFPIEWRSAQGATIVMHMRVRANIPAKQADLILKYLQEESGN